MISACGQDVPHGDLLLATNEINQAAIVFDRTSIRPLHEAQHVCVELRTSARHILHAPTEVRGKGNVFPIWLTRGAKCLGRAKPTAYIWDIAYTKPEPLLPFDDTVDPSAKLLGTICAPPII